MMSNFWATVGFWSHGSGAQGCQSRAGQSLVILLLTDHPFNNENDHFNKQSFVYCFVVDFNRV